MKRKLFAIAIAAISVVSMVGCNKKPQKVVTYAELTLGKYKGVEVERSYNEVTEKELQEYIDSIIESKKTTKEVTEGTLEKEMKVKIDYVSTIDGKEYTGGTATGATVTLKDGSFKIDAVTQALVGKKVGDVVEIDTKYADNYSNSDLKGKAVHFKVTIKAIIETVTPEYNDAFVKEHFSYLGHETVETFNKYLKDDLRITAVFNQVWQTVMDNSTAVSYDSAELEKLVDELVAYQEYILSIYYGYDLNAYLQATNQTEAQFRAEMEVEAKAELKAKMVYEAIIKAENLTITDEEYNQKMLEYAKNYGYEKVEEFSSDYSDMTKEDMKFSMLVSKAQEVIANNVTVIEDKTTPKSEETTTESTTTKAEEATTKAEEATTKAE